MTPLDCLGSKARKAEASEGTPLIGSQAKHRLHVAHQVVLFSFVAMMAMHVTMKLLLQSPVGHDKLEDSVALQKVLLAASSSGTLHIEKPSKARGGRFSPMKVKVAASIGFGTVTSTDNHTAQPGRTAIKLTEDRLNMPKDGLIMPHPRVTDPEKLQPDPLLAYAVKVQPGQSNYASCDGIYIMAAGQDYELNGKPFYVNIQRDRFLAWTGSLWEMTALEYLPQIIKNHSMHGFTTGSFGGYHAGAPGAMTPDAGDWGDYSVSARHVTLEQRLSLPIVGSTSTKFIPSPLHSNDSGHFKKYLFTAMPNGNNYASCDGVYSMADGDDFELNGRPYFVYLAKNRFLAWTGGTWEITSTEYLQAIKQHHQIHGWWPGTFGGFHAGGGDWPDNGTWTSYVVTGKEPVPHRPHGV